MKTEAEIRRHMQDLLICKDKPCGCAGMAHEIKCVIGGKMMEASAIVLSWVLGEDEDYQAGPVNHMRRAITANERRN